MIQEQLVDYISSQMKLGISQEAIKSTLIGAGWAAMDVDDTFKKINGGGAATVAKPATASPAAAVSAKPAAAQTPTQTIRVSDLVSASSTSAMASGISSSTQPKTPSTMQSPTNSAVRPITGTIASAPAKKSGGMIMTIVWIVLVVIFAGLAGYFFYQNMSLSSQVGTVNSQSQGVTAQVSSLQTQVNALTASSTAMTDQVQSLTATNQNLKTELSLFIAPPGATATTTSISLSGTISEVKTTFSLTTADGVKLFIKNSTDPSVVSALQPLASSSQAAQITGTFIPGSLVLTVVTINGTSVYPTVTTTTPATSAPKATTTAPVATSTSPQPGI